MIGKHANKVVASVAEALAPLRDGMTIIVGGFGLSGNAEALIRGVVERGVTRPDARLEQRRQPRQGPRDVAEGRHHPQGDLQLHRRQRGPAHADGVGRGRGRDHAAGHARRAHARGGRRHPGVLHADRRRARSSSEGKEIARDRRPPLHPRARAARRRRARARALSRPLRQPALLPHGAQLQPGDGDGGEADDRRVRQARRQRRDRSRRRPPAGHLRAPHRPRARARERVRVPTRRGSGHDA